MRLSALIQITATGMEGQYTPTSMCHLYKYSKGCYSAILDGDTGGAAVGKHIDDGFIYILPRLLNNRWLN
jgi:hypothetical protein